MNNRDGQDHQSDDALRQNGHSVICEGVDPRGHTFGSIFGEEDESRKETADESQNYCHRISGVETALSLPEEARNSESRKGQDVVQKKLGRVDDVAAEGQVQKP